MSHAKYFFGLFFLLCSLCSVANSAKNETDKLLWQLDFSQVSDANQEETISYLESLGIEFAIESSDVTIEIKNGRLNLNTKESVTVFFGIKFKGKKSLPAKLAMIDWGVNRFSTGANWEKNNNRVAIAAMFALGSETFSSGLPFGINAAPYFLAPFIGEKEKINKLYKGKLYKEAGRYVCVANKKGNIVTHFEIEKFFAVNLMNIIHEIVCHQLPLWAFR